MEQCAHTTQSIKGVGGYFSGMEEEGKILLKIVKDGRLWTCENDKRVLTEET